MQILSIDGRLIRRRRDLALQLEQLDRLLADLDTPPWCYVPDSEGWRYGLLRLRQELLRDLHQMEGHWDRRG